MLWLPYKINQFHVQHDFLFLSKRRGQNNLFPAQSKFNYCRKGLSKKNIKTKKCTPKSVLLQNISLVVYCVFQFIAA